MGTYREMSAKANSHSFQEGWAWVQHWRLGRIWLGGRYRRGYVVVRVGHLKVKASILDTGFSRD